MAAKVKAILADDSNDATGRKVKRLAGVWNEGLSAILLKVQTVVGGRGCELQTLGQTHGAECVNGCARGGVWSSVCIRRGDYICRLLHES